MPDAVNLPDAGWIAEAEARVEWVQTHTDEEVADLIRQLGEALADFMPVAGRWLAATALDDEEQPTDLVLAENRAWNQCVEALAAFRDATGEPT